MTLDDAVGNGRSNRADDVIAVKRALTRLDRYAPAKGDPHGVIDRELDETIRGYPADRDLRVDGWMRPNGETATRWATTWRCWTIELAKEMI